MNVGLFSMPTNPPGRTLIEAMDQTLDVIEHADRLGYSEVWLGEHLTVPWEPIPACDLIIAQALERTTQIKLCAGAYLLPFYHPAELALRIMQLDHMARGRFMCGVAAGFSPSDLRFTGLDGVSGQNRAMMLESLEIMKRIWTDHVGGEWEHVGEYWTVRNPAPMGHHRPHVTPYQTPYPPIALAGLQPKSDTIRLAGENGYIPISLIEDIEALAGHWTLYEDAGVEAGLSPDRSIWRVVRNAFVADTDAEARAWMRSTPFADYANTVMIEGSRKAGRLGMFKHDPDVPDDAVDLDYLMDHWWLVGSPETVTAKLRETYDAVGGFGTLIVPKYDYGDQRDAYLHSLDLLAQEVMPAFAAATDTVEAA